MDPEERQQKLESYASAFTRLVDTLEQIPRQMWDYKPSPELWSVREVVAHIADSEANGYLRFRKCIAEPGQTVMAYEGSLWAEHLLYPQQSVEENLELFRWLRLRTVKLVRLLPEEAWARTVEHPENGMMTLDDLLDVYVQHVPEHIQQMWATYQAWIEQQW